MVVEKIFKEELNKIVNEFINDNKKLNSTMELVLHLSDSLGDAHKSLRKLEYDYEQLEKRISKLESQNYQNRRK